MSSSQSYFMSHILPVYRRAAVWDDNLCWIWQGAQGSMYAMGQHRVKQYIVGSCSDGACSPRMYRMPPVLELDRLLLKDDNTKQYGHPHPDKVGVYMVTDIPRKLLWEDIPIFHPELVESPKPDAPKHVHDAYRKAQDLSSRNPEYFPKWYKQDCDISHSNKGASFATSCIRYNTTIQEDHVIGFHYQGWPEEAEEWRSRARLWPPVSVVEQVLQQGYQVMRKDSSSTHGIDGPLEHHITFTLCERYLARQRTPMQRLVYLMAKTLFYTYLDLHDDENPQIDFPSYALKTSFMWLMEQTPVDMWTEDNVPKLLKELLTHLQESAKTGTLRNYFMIGSNILSNCTPNLLQRAERQIRWILSDLNSFLQGTELYKCNVLLYGCHILMGGNKSYDEMVYQCQNQMLANGLLVAIENVHQARATYRYIIEILEQGTGDGLQAQGYPFDEEECFHILKVMMNVYSSAYMKDKRSKLNTIVSTILNRYPLKMHELINNVLCLDQHLPKAEVTIVRLCVQWQDGTPVMIEPSGGSGDRVEDFMIYLENHLEIFEGIDNCFLGETDLIVVREVKDIKVYKMSSIGDLIELYVRDLHDNEADRWWPQIYSLTHRDIPELQMMDFARMLYLLYVQD